eukprot:TRINITY_DN4599_c0_g1_i4.p1 TRINITY_DN4599_c0_g1~~TRINITY_DN4599_c0_g1_i4.p1  ORF type:complete len:289 (+),score=46.41 TRINITY_DN4599_c0_g1_i4:215-1081(+)
MSKDLEDGKADGFEMEHLVPTAARECRICFEKGKTGRMFDLVAPCLCRGTSKYVHRTCLDQWRAQSASSFCRCHECHFKYRLQHDLQQGRWTKHRYRLYIARDCLFSVAAVLCILGVVAWSMYQLDSRRALVKLLIGTAADRPDLYCWGALVCSLALLGLAASCWQMYLWYMLGEPLSAIDWGSCCWCVPNGCECIECRHWTVWDFYMCTNLLESCMRSGAGLRSMRSDDLPILVVLLCIAVLIFATIGMFVGIYFATCLLYTSDAADEEDSVDLGGRRIIKKKKKKK